MKRRILAVLGIIALLTSLLGIVMPAAADGPPPVSPPTEFPRNNMAPAGPDPMDLTPEMLGEKEVAIRKLAAQIGPAQATAASPIGEPAAVGDEFTFVISDDGLGIDYPEDFRIILEGEHGLILVTEDAYQSYLVDGTYYHFENPNGIPGAPEPWKRMEDLISHDQFVYMLDQFDTVIYPSNTTIYGEPLPRGDEGTKVWLLILNIRDDAYYDPDETTYTVGYFSASESATYNKNIIHIDTYAWADRTGPGVDRPYLYEGAIAHEFEHLIHFDIDPDEPSWVDEGMADIAAFFCGYGHFSGHIANYLVFHPFTSLTFWGSGLEDYGASYLFTLYLYEKFGGAPFISALVNEPANGIEGIENTLAAFGYSDTFDEIFDDWTIANYLDDTRVNDRYGYNNLAIGTIDSWGYSIEYALQNFWEIDPFEVPVGLYSSWFLGAPQPYTAHYYRFGGQPTLRTALDGDELAGTPAHSEDYEWYSGMEIWGWRSFHQSFLIPGTGATLKFWTFYEIEEDWDYGYVEVHDLTDDTWTTLPGIGTVNTLSHPQDNPNTPDGFEPQDYCQPDPVNPPACLSDRWNALTGYSGGWYQESMDLSPFAGHDIELYFRSWQDGAFTLQMMYVDDIEITNGVFPLDDVEGGEDGWTADGWYRTTGILPNNWQATLIESLWQPTARYPKPERWHARKLLDETHMAMDANTQSGEITGIPTTPVESRRTQVLIVSNRSDHILTADYWVEFTN